MNKVTEIVFILDRSGSMGGLEADTVGGFNSMLAKQQEEEGEAYVSTVLFDNEIDVIHDRLPIAEVPQLTAREYFVRGSTARSLMPWAARYGILPMSISMRGVKMCRKRHFSSLRRTAWKMQAHAIPMSA